MNNCISILELVMDNQENKLMERKTHVVAKSKNTTRKKIPLSFDLNKLHYEEGELHPNKEMNEIILKMLKIMYPEFF